MFPSFRRETQQAAPCCRCRRRRPAEEELRRDTGRKQQQQQQQQLGLHVQRHNPPEAAHSQANRQGGIQQATGKIFAAFKLVIFVYVLFFR